MNEEQIDAIDSDSSAPQLEDASVPATQPPALIERGVETAEPTKTGLGFFKRFGAAAKGLAKDLKDRTVTVLAEWQIKKILKNPDAREELSRAITLVLIKEVKRATSLKINSVDIPRVPDDRGNNERLNNFTRAISPILFHLAHHACLSGVNWADTTDGQKSIQDNLVSLIEHILKLSTSSRVNSEGNKADELLGQCVASALQSGRTFIDKKLEGVESQCIQQIVDEALAQLLEDGIDLTESNFDEVLAKVKSIITKSLIFIHADTVQILNDWYVDAPEDVKSEKTRLIGEVESACSAILKKHGTTIAKLFGTSDRITGALNELLDEFINQFRDPEQFKGKLDKGIAYAEPLIVSAIKFRLDALKRDLQKCKAEGKGFKALVDKVASTDRANQQQAAAVLNTELEENPELPDLADVDAVREMLGTDVEGSEAPQKPEHWRRLCEAVVEQLGHGAGQLYDLTTGDVLDLREQDETEQAAGRALLGRHIEAVIGDVVSEGAGFIAQRNAAQQTDGQETGDQQPAEGTTGLIEKLPPLLTTPAVNKMCETLLSAAMREQLVVQVTQAAGQALTSDDKGKATAAGPSAQGAVAKPHTSAGVAVDQVLRKELSDLLRTGADQLGEGLKALPYETVQRIGRDLPLQGLGDGVDWLSDVVKDLFKADEDSARARLTRVLTDRVVSAQNEVIDHVLRWLAGEGSQAGEGEAGTNPNRDKLLDIVVARVNPLVAPAVSGAVVEVTRSTGQAVDPEALSGAIAPFLSEQFDQGEVFKRLSGYGVDQLTALVRKHREAIRQDVKTRARTLMAEVVKDLEGILDGHLETLRAAVATGQQHRVDASKTLARVAKKLDPVPDRDTGLIGIAALDAMGETAEDSEEPQTREHWRQLCEAVVEQLGHGTGQLYDLATGDVLDLRKQDEPEQAAGRLLLGKHIKAVIGEVV
ncbi:hypothetical protein, partial [Endozoicomonas elysicola]|uniref:hypothetical protein n=2 Tax=Endozoicomonas elysicola TaxID=305900 RepID=UPI00136202AC